MSTPAAILLASGAVAFTLWFLGLTRNGHRVVYVTLVAVHHRLIPATGDHRRKDPETGEVAPEEITSVRELVRDMALAAAWHMPRYWWWRKRISSLVRGCLPHPQTLRSPAAAWEPEEVPVPEPPQGRAPALTAPQPRLDEPANPARGYAPPAGWTPYVPEYLPAPTGAPE